MPLMAKLQLVLLVMAQISNSRPQNNALPHNRRSTHEQRDGKLSTIMGNSPAFKTQCDQIDTILAPHYNLTAEELDYIINYDIKYRQGKS